MADLCPICSKARVEEFRPFCSKRCADRDLARWFTGAYAIPVTQETDEDGDSAFADSAPSGAEGADGGEGGGD